MLIDVRLRTFFKLMVRIFYMSDTSSEARQMNRRQILLMNLLNRHQRFNSDACCLALKDMDLCAVCGQQPQQQLLSAHHAGAVTAYYLILDT